MKGIQLRSRCPELHQLLFADDYLFLVKASPQIICNLKDIIDNYDQASCQWVNAIKFSLLFNLNGFVELKRDIEEASGIRNIRDPGRYLGRPTIGRKSSSEIPQIKNQ